MANWRTAFKSDFMASWDLDKPITLTIENVEVKDVKLVKTERKVVANFREKTFENGEPIKPMILNATNCKFLNTHTGTKETNNWNNIVVEIGVVANTGKIGEANGLKILRVLNSTLVDRLPELEELFKTAEFMTEEEESGIRSVIEKKAVQSYDKCINFLKSKQPSNV